MRQRVILLVLLALNFAAAFSQQNQQLVRTHQIFVFPEFRRATIRQTFNRKLTDTVNIYYKDASLVYKKDGKVMRAYLNGIIGVDFDSVRYLKVDSAMARVVEQRGYNYLLCKTVVNMTKYKDEIYNGAELDALDMMGTYIPLNEDKRDEDKGIPLQDIYYFDIKGTIIPANEAAFKKFVSKDQMSAFKVLMANRFWSWKDPESLKMLLDFLPQ